MPPPLPKLVGSMQKLSHLNSRGKKMRERFEEYHITTNQPASQPASQPVTLLFPSPASNPLLNLTFTPRFNPPHNLLSKPIRAPTRKHDPKRVRQDIEQNKSLQIVTMPPTLTLASPSSHPIPSFTYDTGVTYCATCLPPEHTSTSIYNTVFANVMTTPAKPTTSIPPLPASPEVEKYLAR